MVVGKEKCYLKLFIQKRTKKKRTQKENRGEESEGKREERDSSTQESCFNFSSFLYLIECTERELIGWLLSHRKLEERREAC